jgi:hypothetical protein
VIPLLNNRFFMWDFLKVIAGLLAQSEQSGLIRWANVRRLNVHPGPRVISVRNRWRVVVRLYVPVELWDAVLVRLRRGVARV